jgi:hypothetical protein
MDVRTPITADAQPEEGLEWSMAAHLRDVAEETMRSPWDDILAEYDSVDAWLDHCRAQRRADNADRALARAIVALMRDAPGRQRGTLFPADRDRILANPEVAAYFASVAASGDEAWNETRRAAGDVSSVKALLPTWRQWGAVLLEAGAVGDLDSMFIAPDNDL